VERKKRPKQPPLGGKKKKGLTQNTLMDLEIAQGQKSGEGVIAKTNPGEKPLTGRNKTGEIPEKTERGGEESGPHGPERGTHNERGTEDKGLDKAWLRKGKTDVSDAAEGKWTVHVRPGVTE